MAQWDKNEKIANHKYGQEWCYIITSKSRLKSTSIWGKNPNAMLSSLKNHTLFRFINPLCYDDKPLVSMMKSNIILVPPIL